MEVRAPPALTLGTALPGREVEQGLDPGRFFCRTAPGAGWQRPSLPKPGRGWVCPCFVGELHDMEMETLQEALARWATGEN